MAQAKQDLQAIINAAAEKEGLDPELLQKIGGAESSLKATAKNPKSTAKGLFQFVDKTWAEMGGKPGEQYNPQKNAELGARYVKRNMDTLTQALGREPSYGEVYAAHFFGPTGAKALLTKADPNAPIEQSLAMFESPKRVQKVLKQNPNLKGKTTAEVLADLDAKMGSKKPVAAPTVAAPTPPTKPKMEMFRRPVPRFIRSEAPNLGTGYNAALALMGMTDTDEDPLTKAQETVAENEADNEVADFGQAQKMLAQVQAPNAFANRQMAQQQAQPQQPRLMAEGGFVVPTQRNIYRAEDKAYLDEQLAAWNKYNEEANVYNQKLAEYQGSEPVKQYATAAEAYNAARTRYDNEVVNPYNEQLREYNARAEAFNNSPEFADYRRQVDEYNAARIKYENEVIKPYIASVDAYNTGFEQFQQSDPYKQYTTAAEEYNRQVDEYNALAKNFEQNIIKIAGPIQFQVELEPFTGVAPTAPTYNTPKPTDPTPFTMEKPTEVKFGYTAPVKPADFTMAPPTAPAGFEEKAPTQPGESMETIMARKAKANQIAAQDAEQRGLAINVANNPNQFNLAGFGSAGINAPNLAMFNKGGEARKSDKDGEAERFFEDFMSAAKESGPLDLSFQSAPSQVVEGLGMVNAPPAVSGRVGTKFDALGGNVRVGAQGIAMQTPDKKILAMPGMYDIGYNTQVGPGNLDLSFQRQIQSMPGRAKDYAINARYSYKFAEGGEAKADPEKGSAKAMLKEVARSTQYLPADIAGAPVDLINLGLQGVDALTGSKLAQKLPVGGSEWLIDKANKYGLMDKPTGSLTETLTRLGTGVLSPTAGPRAAVAAGKAIKGTAKAALEDLSMAGTGQGGSKVAQSVARATGLEPSFAVPKNAKSQLQELDASMVRPSESSPFVGRLEQTLFDTPQDIFTPQQLMGWAKKNLPGQDADRLTQAVAPLMEQKRLTKKEILETVAASSYNPKRYRLDITEPNQPIQNNPYLSTYTGEDFPYIGVDKLKSTGVIVARKPYQDVGELRLEGALNSVVSYDKAVFNSIAGVDLKTAPGNLQNIKSYLKELSLDPNAKKEGAALVEQFASANDLVGKARYADTQFNKYLANKSQMSTGQQIRDLDELAKIMGVDTVLLTPEQAQQKISSTISGSLNGDQAKVADLLKTQLKRFILDASPEKNKFFIGRNQHEFQGANAIGFSRYADVNVDGKNMMGISEFQSDLRRSLKETRSSPTGKASREAEAIEMFPNMEKRPEVITQNLIKNAIYAAAKMDKDGIILPGMMSKKAELYTSVNKHAKAALKDMGLDTSYLKRVDPTKVYDKNILEKKMLSHYNDGVDTGNEVYFFDKLPYEEQQYLLDYFSPYSIYLPKKERKSILQYGIPYAKGGMVDKNDADNQKYI
jgi:hypothetical protein